MAGWPVAIWSTVRRTTEHRHLPTALFPPRWWRLCSVQYRYNAPRLWNEAHPLVTAADAASLDWIESIGGQAPDFDALQHRQDLLSSGPRAAALLVTLIDQDRTQLWRGLVDRASDFVRQLWALLFGSEERYHCLLTWSSFSFYKLAVDGWTTHRANDPAIEDLLPDPGPDWTVQRVEARPARRKRQPIRPTPSAGPSRGSRPG